MSGQVSTFNALIPNVSGANTGKVIWTSLWADSFYRNAVRIRDFTPNAPPNRVFLVNRYDVTVSSDFNNWANPPNAPTLLLQAYDQTNPPCVANGAGTGVNWTGFFCTATITRLSTDESVPVRAVFRNITPDPNHRSHYTIAAPGNYYVGSENIGFYQGHDTDSKQYLPRQGNAGTQGIPYSTTLVGGNTQPCTAGTFGLSRILSCTRNIRDMDIIYQFDYKESSNCKITYTDIW